MKKLVMLFALLLLAVPAFASYQSCPTPGVPSETYTDNDTQRQKWGYGIGADVVVYKTDSPYLTEVTVEPRYDIENRETRVFAVAKVDLWKALTGK